MLVTARIKLVTGGNDSPSVRRGPPGRRRQHAGRRHADYLVAGQLGQQNAAVRTGVKVLLDAEPRLGIQPSFGILDQNVPRGATRYNSRSLYLTLRQRENMA